MRSPGIRSRRLFYCLSCLALLVLPAMVQPAGAVELPLEKIKLPAGFRIAVFAEVPGARSLAYGERGTLFVGTREEGDVYAVRDVDNDKKADEVIRIAGGLNMPNGVAFRGGDLFVAEVSRVIVYEGIEDRLHSPPKPRIVNDDFPDAYQHGWKFIAFGPDGRLYVPVGMPCDVCLPAGPLFGTIVSMRPDGGDMRVFARGIRNTVGFDWDPRDRSLWFTENGQDMLGDDVPPDELNRAPGRGLHFGFPYFSGSWPDPRFKAPRSRQAYTFPSALLGAHVAALGMRFYTGEMFPPEYRDQIIIAEHGSWARTVPVGYRLTLARRKGKDQVSYETFSEGWLQRGRAWGRPVDLLVMPDGSLLVSDDLAGVIYRISYSG